MFGFRRKPAAAPPAATSAAEWEWAPVLAAVRADPGDGAVMPRAARLRGHGRRDVAHLAGALGRPVWILLPHAPDWRWLLERTCTPWYPTARLYRQPATSAWAAGLAQVRQDLGGGTSSATIAA